MFQVLGNNTNQEEEEDKTQWAEAKEMKHLPFFTGCSPNVINHSYNGLNISYLSRESVVNNLLKHPSECNIAVKKAEEDENDLIPGEYEGGLKVWECTQYLGQFIVGEGSLVAGEEVLDLGCGAGILGIIALKLGAKCVTFQDYNEEVLRFWTMRNVALNECHEPSKYWCGDWSDFANKVGTKFDVILTSETIYNPKCYKKIIQVLKNTLKPETGVMYLAAKSYYFGVLGAVYDFEKRLEESGFHCETVWKSHQGVSKEILKITWAPKTSA